MKRILALMLVVIYLLCACGGDDKEAASSEAPPVEGSFAALIGATDGKKLCLGDFMLPEAASVERHFGIENGVEILFADFEAEEITAFAKKAFDYFKSQGFTMYKTVFSEKSGRPQAIAKTDAASLLKETDKTDLAYEIIYSKEGKYFTVEIKHYKAAEGLYFKGDTVLTIEDSTEILKDFIGK